jgi:hypothetical protein
LPLFPVPFECVNIEELRWLIIDTDSNVSKVQPRISGSDVVVSTMKHYGVTGQVLDTKGRQSVTFEFLRTQI